MGNNAPTPASQRIERMNLFICIPRLLNVVVLIPLQGRDLLFYFFFLLCFSKSDTGLFVRFEGTSSANETAFRTETEHKLSAKTKTTRISPQINSLAAHNGKRRNAKMAHGKKASHQICAQHAPRQRR